MEAFQQAIADRVAEEQRHHGKSQFFWVWGALLAMTAIEVYLTYQNMHCVFPAYQVADREVFGLRGRTPNPAARWNR